MDLKTTEAAKIFIQKKIGNNTEEQSIVIYQYNKRSCIDSYLDYVIEIDSKNRIIKQGIYENWKNLGNDFDCSIDIYVEKRLKEDWEKTGRILLDIEVTYKFNEKYETLILKEVDG